MQWKANLREVDFMSDDKKKTNEKPFGLDMGFQEAVERYTKVTKEEIQEHESKGELVYEGETQIALFKKRGIRQVFHEGEWYFSIVDTIEALTDTKRPRKYWSDLKSKLTEQEDFIELSANIGQLPMESPDGKMRETDVVNAETLFRIVQSIPSKKAEPFKKWLARVGFERIQEFQNPELAIKRAVLSYKVKGYTDEWINHRIQTIASRKELTHEWAKRGVIDKEYALLTDEISLGTFKMRTQRHKDIKGLKKHHILRDHMSPLELALTMLGETATSEIARNIDAQGFDENKDAAKSGGEIAGKTRADIERRLKRSVITKENYLPESKQGKLKK
jgi:hypothetical protein